MLAALILGLGALLLYSAGSGGSGGSTTVPQEKALLVEQDGILRYKPEAFSIVSQALKSMGWEPFDGNPYKWRIVELGADQGINSAYNAAATSHGVGYNVWITPNLMTPGVKERVLYLTDAQSPLPPKSEGLALLISGLEAWPNGGQEPPPIPPAPPPPPMA